MKNAIILHGTGCTPKSYWMGGIASYLKKNGYKVYAPQLPDADKPDLKKWLPKVLDEAQFTKETLIIGHSAGGPLTLSILENIKTKIDKAILVAGFGRKLRGDKKLQPIQQKKYNWKKIKNNVKDIIFINSNDDPWTIDHDEGLYLFNKLGGTLIIREGEGHMGSDTFKQPYKKFEFLEKLIDLKYSRNSIK
jgi:hypothetical protein